MKQIDKLHVKLKSFKKLNQMNCSYFFSSTILLICLLLFGPSIKTSAQAPKSFSFQGLARGSSGTPISKSSIAIRASVINNTANGTLLYQESFTQLTVPVPILILNKPKVSVNWVKLS